MIQTKTLDFTGKIAGSTVENKNVAKLNGVEFTQLQYDQIFGSQLLVTTTDVLEFEFPVPDDVKIGLEEVNIYYKSKMDSGENELRSSDKGVYNKDTTIYKQKMLAIYKVDVENDVIKFNITSTGNYGIYEVKCDCLFDDAGLNSYSGNYTYLSGTGMDTTVTISRKKLETVITEIEALPVNSLSYLTIAQVPTAGDLG